MSAELITAALLNVPSVTGIVGTRRAVSQLNQGTAMPALVYEVVNAMPIMTINEVVETQLLTCRVQVTGMASSPAGVDAVLSAVMSAMHLKSGTFANKLVSSVVRDIRTGITKDNDAGIWYASQDFIIHFYE